jgi:hypothetical protein
MLHAYRKSDHAYFPCWPTDVCYEWDGDLNPGFITNRPELLGDLRKTFEPVWALVVGRLLSKSVTDGDKLAISGYMANLMTSTPAWRRVSVEICNHDLRNYLILAKKMQEKHGGNDELPVEAIAMMERGEITIKTDQNYVKAVLTKKMINHAWVLYNQDWIVLQNDTAAPFITSDNPVAILNPDFGQANRYLPVTPHLCVLIPCRRHMPSLTEDTISQAIRSAPQGHIAYGKVTAAQARAINRLITQCADDLVFSSAQSSGIAALVKKYGRFRVDAEFLEFPAREEEAIYQGVTIRVREPPIPR